MQTTLLQILPLFIIIAIGWTLVKLKIAKKNWLKPLGDFALFVGFPSLIFGNLTKNIIDFKLVELSFIRVSLLLLGMLCLILFVLKFVVKKKQNKATIILCFLFGNAAFLGIPLLTSINKSFNQIASINASVMLFWVFSLGLIIVEWYTKDRPSFITIIKSLFKNPLLLSVVLGISFNYLNISIPDVIQKPIEMIGIAVSPMVMIMIGIFIGCHPLNSIKAIKAPLFFSLFKLLIFPIIGLFLFSLNSKHELSSIVQFAMPAAITPFAMADRYKLNKVFICNSIIISTLISLITIPIMIYLFNFIN